MEKVIEKYQYHPEGTCSSEMNFEIEDNKILSLEIVGGCPGNTLGVSKLCVGRTVDEVIELLHGIPCRNRGTSCPDQIAKALIKYKEQR